MKFNRKPILFIILLLILTFAFSACSAKSDNSMLYPSGGDPGMDSEESGDNSAIENSGVNVVTADTRKIIYNVETDLSVDDLDDTVSKIEDLLAADEWFDYQSTSNGYAYFVARIKTSRLDAFLDSLSALSSDFYYTKSANDISLSYTSKEDRIATLNEEKNLLLTYAETLDATPYEFLQRIAGINTEIANLTEDLNQYDSLIEYSEVSIRVNEKYTAEELAYRERANNVFYKAWEAFKAFIEFIGLAIIAIFPFLLIIAPVTCGIIFIVRFKKRKPPFDKIKRKEKKEYKPLNTTITDNKAEENDKQ